MSTLADYTMSRATRDVLRPIARIVCTDEVEALGLTEDVLAHAELTLRSFPPLVRLGLVAGAKLFDASAIAFYGKRFSRLPRPQQEAWFERWWSSERTVLRQFAKGAKALVSLAYWEHPVVRRRLEYHPERWIAEVAARRLDAFAEDIARHDRLVLEPDPLVPARALARRKAQHG